MGRAVRAIVPRDAINAIQPHYVYKKEKTTVEELLANTVQLYTIGF
jgi:hypothetical protein